MADLLLYDGVCGLCHRLVQFVLARDARDHFRFASLQGAVAKDALAKYGQDASDLNTVYVFVDYGAPTERLLWKGRAIVHVLRQLGGVWSLAVVLGWLPWALVDAVYDFVARRRYRVFGKFDSCALPPAKDRAKFLEDG